MWYVWVQAFFFLILLTMYIVGEHFCKLKTGKIIWKNNIIKEYKNYKLTLERTIIDWFIHTSSITAISMHTFYSHLQSRREWKAESMRTCTKPWNCKEARLSTTPELILSYLWNVEILSRTLKIDSHCRKLPLILLLCEKWIYQTTHSASGLTQSRIRSEAIKQDSFDRKARWW